MEEERHLSLEEKLAKGQLKVELEKVLLMEEINCRQKSLALWLREGDNNTEFFHRIANSNHRINTIGRLSVNGVVTHGFKNRTGERTGKESGSRTSGPTGVGPVVEPVTS